MDTNKSAPRWQSLLILTIMELWDRFTFYGTLTLLILYLTGVLNFPETNAYSFWGLFLIITYLLPFIGGLIADKYLGYVKTMLIGSCFMVAGCIILAFNSTPMVFYIGISLLILGIGLFKSNISSLVGTLYDEKSPKKDLGFTYFFVGMASGATLGPIVYGLMLQYISWQAGFIISAVGIFTSTLLFVFHYHKINFKSLPKIQHTSLFTYITIAIVMAIMLGVIDILLHYQEIGDTILGVFSIATTLILTSRSMHCEPHEIKKLVALFILLAITVFYYAAALQVDGSMILFIKKYIHHTMFNWQIPVTAFSSIEPIFAVSSAPLLAILWAALAKRNKDLSICQKVVASMISAALCFACFVFAALWHYAVFIPLFLLILGNLFLGVSDSLEIPTVMSAISRYSPKHLTGSMMGVAFMRHAVAGYIASLLGDLTVSSHSEASSLNGYIYTFGMVGIICLIIAIVLFFISPSIQQLLGEKS